MVHAKNLVSLVAVLALAVLSIASVSAFASVDNVYINNVEMGSTKMSVSAGETLSVRVQLYAYADASDVRVKAWLASQSDDNTVSTNRFDVIADNMYTKTLSVTVPTNINPSEEVTLYVFVEGTSANGARISDGEEIVLTAQRDSYNLEVLDVAMDTKVEAGANLALSIVLKNRGSHSAEDTFVTARIPSLGIEERAYFGDLSALDDADADREDSAEGKMYLHIPSNAKPGIYDVEVETFNADSDESVTKKVVIVGGASEDTMSASAAKIKSFAVGEDGVYSLTLVNSGDNVRIYELVAESSDKELELTLDEPFVVIPAGTSKTVKVTANAVESGDYSFSVKAFSGSELASKTEFTARVKGSKGIASGNDAAVLLTVVLAIIFVVLLVVLIVLLTRKPQKAEEFGESYY